MKKTLSQYTEDEWMDMITNPDFVSNLGKQIDDFKADIGGKRKLPENKYLWLTMYCAGDCGKFIAIADDNIDSCDYETKCMIFWDDFWCFQCRPYRFGKTVKRHLKKRDVLPHLIALHGLECNYCELTWDADCRDVTIDHRVPIGRETELPQGIGIDDLANLAICCRSCNSSKNRMTESEYREYKNLPPTGKRT